MAKLDIANQTVPATPSSGVTSVYVDSATKKLKTKDDAGVVTDYSAAGNSITQLTGDVTATGPGIVAATVTNSAVIAKVLTGFVATTGTVAATDSILQAIQKLAARNNSAWFGTGIDGDVTLSSNTALVRDMYYNSLTVNPGVVLTTNGFRIFAATAIINNGTIERNGLTAIGNAAGVAALIGTVSNGGAGGVGGGAAGGTVGVAVSPALGGNGGAGGLGAGGAGGGAGTAVLPTAIQGGQEVLQMCRQAVVGSIAGASPTLILGGGGGGGGGGSTVAGSGGGGGSGAGLMVLATRSLTGTGSITAIGGSGASAVLANGGGGGAGGGGVISLVTENDTTATSLTFSVAAGGVGGGLGSGLSGASGSIGRIFRTRT